MLRLLLTLIITLRPLESSFEKGTSTVMKQSEKVNRGIGVLPVLLILFVLVLIGSFAVSIQRWEGQPPTIRFDREFKSLGRKPPLSLQIEDAGNGLSQIAVSLKQKDQLVSLVEESYPGPSLLAFWRTGEKKSATIDLGKLISEKYKIQDGPASLMISASDHSWRGFFRGNHAQQQRDFVFDIYPPRLEVLSSQHYINQ